MKIESLISIKTVQEIEVLRKAGKILASIIRELTCSLKSGMTTQAIDDVATSLIESHGVEAAFKGYRGFPGAVCVSVNQQVVHGVPGPRLILEGDLVSIDIGIIYQKYYSDTAVTVGIGKIKPKLQMLLEVTRTALYKGIAQAKVGNHLSDISAAVQGHVEAQGLSVVRDFVGHGIGQKLHEPPEIPNFGLPHRGPVLKEGMVFAIEPMVNLGTWQTKILGDGWTVETADGQHSAHFEHTIAVAANGPEILTENGSI